MSRSLRLLCALGLAVVVPTTAPMAQAPWGAGGPGSRGGPPGALALVRHPAVQEELGLSDAQRVRLRVMGEALGRDRRTAALGRIEHDGPNGPEARRRRDDAALSGLLTRDQRDRLEQIVLQIEGPRALASRADLQDRLRLDPGQRARFLAILERDRAARDRKRAERRAQFQALARNDAGGLDLHSPSVRAQFDRMRREAKALDDETARQVAAVLTPSQAEAYAEMLGEPFDVARLHAYRGPRHHDHDRGHDARPPMSGMQAASRP